MSIFLDGIWVSRRWSIKETRRFPRSYPDRLGAIQYSDTFSNVANFVMSSCIAHSWLHSKSIRRAQPFTTQVENMAGNSTTQNGQASKSDDAQLKAICTHFSSLELKFCLISVELTMVCMREDLLASRYKIDNRMLHYCCFVNKCRDTLFRGNGKCVLLDV